MNTYTITASSTGITSASQSAITIINYVYAIALQSSVASPDANFDFTIIATFRGEDNNLFTTSCTSYLTGTPSVAGTSSLTTSSGSSIYTVHFSTSGSKTITVTVLASGSSPEVSQTISLTALSNALKITSPSPAVLYI